MLLPLELYRPAPPTFAVIYRQGGATVWGRMIEAPDAEDAMRLAWGEYVDQFAGGDLFADFPADTDVQVMRFDA